jgi:site-specific DNA recombinase
MTVIPFASWGRVSTEDRQDPESSRAWQRARATALIEPHGGQIVAEFFDVDKSRSIPPQRRPEAARLLAALADPSRGFAAVVVGSRNVRSTATSSAIRSRCSLTTRCRCGCRR